MIGNVPCYHFNTKVAQNKEGNMPTRKLRLNSKYHHCFTNADSNHQCHLSVAWEWMVQIRFCCISIHDQILWSNKNCVLHYSTFIILWNNKNCFPCYLHFLCKSEHDKENTLLVTAEICTLPTKLVLKVFRISASLPAALSFDLWFAVNLMY